MTPEELWQQVRIPGGQVGDHDVGDTGLRQGAVEERLKGGQAAGGGPDADNTSKAFDG